MPRNVRNFWIEATVDGRQERIESGPRSKDGGFDLTIKMRDGGGIVTALDVRGIAQNNGTLTLAIFPKHQTTPADIGAAGFEIVTTR